MARVRLRVWNSGRTLNYQSRVPPIRPEVAPFLRLKTEALLGADPPLGETDNRPSIATVIDTGSPFSLIESGTWEQFARLGLLDRLELIVEPPLITVAGTRSSPYQLGVMQVAVVERLQNGLIRALPAVPVLFQLLEKRANLPDPVILGLHNSVLEGRWLVRRPVPVATAPEDRNDYGPRSGQQWWLQDEPPT